MEWTAPAWLAAGALAALVPLALHLVVRRPPARRSLPTLRFLRRDARSSVRLRRRPSDVPLLLLRMLFLGLLGAALAGPRWVPERGGTATVVLLDRGGWTTEDGWRDAVAVARARLLAEDGTAAGALVLFDTSAAVVPPSELTAETFDSLEAASPAVSSTESTRSPSIADDRRREVPSRYAAAFRGLRAALPALRGVDSVRTTLLAVPRRGAWGPGTAALRADAWPGRIEVVDGGAGGAGASRTSAPAPGPSPGSGGGANDGTASSEIDGSSSDRGTAVVAAGADGGRFVAAALEAVGWSASRAASSDAPSTEVPDLVVLVGRTDPVDVARWLGVAAGGATVVVSADAVVGVEDAPWIAGGGEGDDAERVGTMWVAGGVEGRGAVRLGGRPAEDVRVVGAWEDGRPAAATAPVGDGCVVAVGTRLETGALPLDPSFPRFVDALARTCAADSAARVDDELPLDAGALALLRGDDRPNALPLADVVGPDGGDAGGIPLGRWLLAAVLLVAVVEGWMAYGRRRGTSDDVTSDDAAPRAERAVRDAEVVSRR